MEFEIGIESPIRVFQRAFREVFHRRLDLPVVLALGKKCRCDEVDLQVAEGTLTPTNEHICERHAARAWLIYKLSQEGKRTVAPRQMGLLRKVS